MKRRALSSAIAALAVLFVVVPSASAVTYEVEPPFCKPALLRDYLKPLERLPRLPSPPSGRLPFGPERLGLRPMQSLVVGSGRVGYDLVVEGRAPVHPDWRVTTTLERVDWRGRPVKTIATANRQLRTIRSDRRAGDVFELKGAPAPYRVITVFRSKSGEQLGRFGFYFRLVRPTESAILALNASSYRPGQTVFARVENRGTELVGYGVPYAIERLSGSTWSKAPESPRGPWILPLLLSNPGMSGRCTGFWITPDMPAGRYRMVKEIDFMRQSGKDRSKFLLAEFDVLAN